MRNREEIENEVYEEGSTQVSIFYKIFRALLEIALDNRDLLTLIEENTGKKK